VETGRPTRPRGQPAAGGTLERLHVGRIAAQGGAELLEGAGGIVRVKQRHRQREPGGNVVRGVLDHHSGLAHPLLAIWIHRHLAHRPTVGSWSV